MSALSCHPEARSQSASAVSSRSTTSREKLVSSSDSRMAQISWWRGGRYPGGGQTSTNQVKEYKVYVTSDTVLKLEDQDMVFSDMHVGDRIIVSGIPKGSGNDLEATSIKRKF